MLLLVPACVGEEPDVTAVDWQCEGGRCDAWEEGSSGVCKVSVRGIGTREVEADYLPHVVACENGNASPEALRAQAVAARTFLYYVLSAESRSIGTGESRQVYSCGRQPTADHIEAVRSTAGQVLAVGGTIICSFYVAGAIPSASSCQARSGDRDPTRTEWAVTYNSCKSGSSIQTTRLGTSSSSYNHGCMSQNGSDCLADQGASYQEILRFYYGDDIQIVQAQGACIQPDGRGECGDGRCDASERCDSCPDDCGPCSCGGGGGGGGGDPGDACTARGVAGECVPTSECPLYTHEPVAGFCPGTPASVQCCIPYVCSAPEGSGTCMSVSQCSGSGGVPVAGLCPGSRDIQCCVGSDGGVGGGGCGDDPAEPNDTEEAAASLLDYLGQSLEVCEEDEEFFQVGLTAGEVAEFALLTGAAPLDVDMEVLYPDGQRSTAVTAGVGGETLVIDPVPMTGTYLLHVWAYEGAGTYTIDLREDYPDWT
jgi:hypothetical protein